MTVASRGTVIRLNWEEDDDTKVIVTPSNQDRYMQSVKQVIEACQMKEAFRQIEAQLDSLLARLGEWVRDHLDSIHRAFVTVRETSLLFLIVQPGKAYDAELEEALSAIDMEIALSEEYSSLKLSVLALPNSTDDSTRAFLHPDFALEYKQRDA